MSESFHYCYDRRMWSDVRFDCDTLTIKVISCFLNNTLKLVQYQHFGLSEYM